MKYTLLISIPLAWMWMYTKTMVKKNPVVIYSVIYYILPLSSCTHSQRSYTCVRLNTCA